MANAPVISIFLASGGKAVAKGVLVASRHGKAGLFSPWPEVLSDGVEFGVHVPKSDRFPEEWLTPAEAGIFRSSNQQNPTLGVVSFIRQPEHEAPLARIEYSGLPGRVKRSMWAALETARPEDVKQLRELIQSPAGQEERTPPLTIAGDPQPRHTAAAIIDPGSFFCRYLLRWD